MSSAVAWPELVEDLAPQSLLLEKIPVDAPGVFKQSGTYLSCFLLLKFQMYMNINVLNMRKPTEFYYDLYATSALM